MTDKTISFQVREDIKERFESIANEIGVPMTDLIIAFMNVTVRDGKLPFALGLDEYTHHQWVIGKLKEAETEASDSDTTWLTQEEVFSGYRGKYGYEV